MDKDSTVVSPTSAPVAPAERADSFLGKLMRAAENLVHLQVVTVVGDVELSGDVDHPQIKFPANFSGSDSVIVTNINLVDSDITTVIPPKYENEIDGPIMKYHADQVAQANQSMDKKLQLIQSLITDIVPKLKSTPSST
ncbi:MAG: hypothetical protein OXF79_02985 [Chloroflexi bacterium]|nr:hypothetical protein [Chloroflexota bacterium]